MDDLEDLHDIFFPQPPEVLYECLSGLVLPASPRQAQKGCKAMKTEIQDI